MLWNISSDVDEIEAVEEKKIPSVGDIGPAGFESARNDAGISGKTYIAADEVNLRNREEMPKQSGSEITREWGNAYSIQCMISNLEFGSRRRKTSRQGR